MPFEDDKPKDAENSPFEAPSVLVVKATLCKVKCGSLPTENARATAVAVDGVKLDTNFVPSEMIEGKKEITIEVIF